MQQTANKVPPRNSASDGKRARKSEAVFQDLRRKVLTGELTSESPITEQSLAQDYGCSQSTIREALMLLQEYGLVVRLGYQGTFVTNPSQLEARLMLRLRIDIETTGIAEAVGNVTPEDLAELRELDRQFERCHANRDVFGCAEIDLSFHLKLFRIARMPVLEPMLVRTITMVQRVMLPTRRSESDWRDPSVTRHRVIIEALEARNVQRTLAALKAHILSSAVLLAPHFYGTDLDDLNGEYDDVPLGMGGARRI
ncbi:GntR family transcriptional regulator [Roseibium salinum]|uniref:GntR family transcriptional regulator n=1 Tax=Roseibium salinum TaxID=1604349 RepID=A0ABT3R2P8_9HYPH|nr:GntR family transcriptional regulator [Roseibium sp. DSM 29163]MCX2723525.1 GntR family transcriptional regulator [Roseibium sp. DSM 29163]